MINQYTPDTLDVSSVAIHTDRTFDFGGIPQIYAESLSTGDVIEHLGVILEISSKVHHLPQGIRFKVKPLEENLESYWVTFDPNWRFNYVTYIQEAA